MTIDFEEEQLSRWIEDKLVPLGPLAGVPNEELCKKFREFFAVARAPKRGDSAFSEFEEKVMGATCKLGRWLRVDKKVEGGEQRLLRNVYAPYLLSLQRREARAEEGGGDVISIFRPRQK